MSSFSTIVFAFLALFQLFIDATSTFSPIPPNQILSISKDISVYVPWQYCLPENCPPSLGTCNHETNTCEFKAPFKGLATHPEAYATQYCDLAPTGCLGVTYVNTPYNTAKNIGQTFNLPLCGEATTGQKCVGIVASPSRMNGNAQTAQYANGSYVKNWGMGLTEASGVCYELVGPGGATILVAQTDRCGGYCTCSAQKEIHECGPCVNDNDLAPGCPCVGTVPPIFSTCCGLNSYGCPTTVQTCDWCASQNHPHFDVDIAAFNYLCGADSGQGSCKLLSAKPVRCMDPVAWPPSGGGGGGDGPTCQQASSYNCQSGGNDPVNQPSIPDCLGCCCNWGWKPSTNCSCSPPQ